MAARENRLVVVSNRLPVRIDERPDGTPVLEPAAGGLVTAMKPILEANRGLWIGWPGQGHEDKLDRLVADYNAKASHRIHAIPLTPKQEQMYYRGFANETIWPLFHDLLGNAQFHRETWRYYNEVNRLFAEHIAEHIEPDDFVWIHDYQLMMVAHHLRELGVEHRLAYFHHIPFPGADLYRRLPWREKLLRGLLEYDLVGFQTQRDRHNLVESVREFLPEVRGRNKRRHTDLTYGQRTVRAGNYPISIDFEEFDADAREPEVEDLVASILASYPAEKLVLGLDRLDYTKGIPERFRAFERLLEKYPEFQGKVSLLQVVVPSRTAVARYAELKSSLDELIGHINGRFGSHGYVPIHYYFKHLDRPELLAHYRAADVALLTPLRDGMNLVAKEYAAAKVREDGVLVLSEFTGSAAQLGHDALLVNPYDLEGTADTIRDALTMEREQMKQRMRRLRRQVRRNDVHRWVGWFTESLFGTQQREEKEPG